MIPTVTIRFTKIQQILTEDCTRRKKIKINLVVVAHDNYKAGDNMGTSEPNGSGARRFWRLNKYERVHASKIVFIVDDKVQGEKK